jgi:hypothetical protein
MPSAASTSAGKLITWMLQKAMCLLIRMLSESKGKEVMIAEGDKFEIKTVPLSAAADNAIVTKADFNLTDNGLKGKVKVTLTGNQRTDFHQAYQNMPSKYTKRISE